MNRLLKAFALVLITAGFTYAQTAKDFTLTDVRTKKEVSLSDYSGEKGVVVIFTSNVCPYSVYYEGRITQLIAQYQNKGIAFILINSHKEAKESISEMANKIAAWGLNVPYLADKDQKVLAQFKARKSPEAFLLKNNGSFSVYYHGAIDNNPQVASDVKESYLKKNIELLLQGKPSHPGSKPIGCMVKRE